jgi:hypothetical protein
MQSIIHSRGVAFGLSLSFGLLLLAPLGGRAEEVSLAPASATTSDWDERSGYGAVEASRATADLAVAPMDITSLVPSDVRWAPEEVSENPLIAAHEAVQAGYLGSTQARAAANMVPVVPMHVVAAQRALQTSDPGSIVEEALLRIVAGYYTWDALSGYGSVEASRAAISALP